MTETSIGFDITDIESLDTDIVMTIERKPSSTHGFLQEFKETTDPRYRFCTALNIVPNFSRMQPVNVNNVHYVLLLDKSGSMGDTYRSNNQSDIEICKTAAKHFVAMLPTESTFDVYTFNSSYEKFQGKFTDTNAKKVKAAEWIDTIQADGGTNILPALTDIYESLQRMEKQGVVVVLSDGGVTNTEDVLKLVKQNPNVRVFSIGIGASVSQDLIQGLATQGNGYAEFIGSGDKNIIQKVRSQLKRSQDTLRKCQNNYEVDIKSADGDSNFTMVPKQLAPLYDRTNNMVYVFSEQPLSTIQYTERYNGSNNPEVTDITPVQVIDPDVMFHRIAGVRLLNHLQYEKSRQQKSLIPGIATDVDANSSEMIKISINLNVLSKYTAFVGVESRENKITGEMKLCEIPLQLPAKYQDRRYGDCRAMCSPSAAAFGGNPRSMQNNIANITNRRNTKCKSFTESAKKNNLAFDRASYPEPQNESCEESIGFSLFSDNNYQSGMDLGASTTCKSMDIQLIDSMDQFYSYDGCIAPTITPPVVSLVKPTPRISLTLTLVGSGICIELSGGLLTGMMNGSLIGLLLKLTGLVSLPDTLSVGDVIELCNSQKKGTMYEIISLGSDNEPWTLQQC
jgi:hypothetical protein